MTLDRLVLVGAPAAGKTTVGRLVAERLGTGFADTDEQVAADLGLSLPEAYASLSEAELARAQTRASLPALRQPGVISLGSAAVEADQVRTALQGLPVVWLRVSVPQATRRLGMSALGMETLTVMRKQLDALLQAREHWYERVAAVQVDTDRLSVAEVADRVIEVWRGLP
ncbi:MAG: shikimate kinase [Propionicimonas sp.]|uniref:shikimate kinase n=1 Tax=Propionicimonas sp. TaxID=1955623 RepID=UPI002B1FACC4|nr:shikimate kinase [Propionicimonas sp.]MEA4943116.1 shikimate kinase [Propionicimonas sp.]